MPHTTPVVEPTAAHEVHEGSLHVPPGLASVKVRPQLPTHTCGLVGAIAAGAGWTVIVFETEQSPAPVLYTTVYKPGAIPVTVPENAPIEASVPGPPLQVPPETELVSVIEAPGHTVDGPPIGPGIG